MSSPRSDTIPLSCFGGVFWTSTTILINAAEIIWRFRIALGCGDRVPSHRLLILLRDSMSFIVNQAKLQLRSAVALFGQFAVDTYGRSEIAFVIGGFGCFERARDDYSCGHH